MEMASVAPAPRHIGFGIIIKWRLKVNRGSIPDCAPGNRTLPPPAGKKERDPLHILI